MNQVEKKLKNQIEKQDGLTCLSKNPGKARIHIVYVHGLGGGGYSTWNAEKENAKEGNTKEEKVKEGNELGYWPSNIAEQFPICNVWVLHYTADFIDSPFKKTKTLDILDKSQWLVEKLVQNKIHKQPIVFICHSLGGLLVKQALQFSQSLGPDTYRSIWAQTQAMIFLATPHSGSNLSNIAERITQVMNNLTNGWSSFLFKPSKAITNLEKNNPTLRYIDKWFRYYAPVQGIDTLAYAETEKTYGVMIVDVGSANPNIPGSVFLALSGENHISIAKPENDRKDVYQAVASCIESLEERVRDDIISTSSLIPTRKELERVAYNRKTISRICGWWWEMIRADSGIEVSLFEIRPNIMTNSVFCKGKHFDEDGNFMSKWHSEVADIETKNSEIVIRYYWKGERILGEEAGNEFQGFGQFKFDEPNSVSKRIDKGSGNFWDLNESHPEQTKKKVIESLWRETDTEIIWDINEKDGKKRKLRVMSMIERVFGQ